MRKCIRCKTEMIENLDVKVDMQGYGIKITRDGVFDDTVQKPKYPSFTEKQEQLLEIML